MGRKRTKKLLSESLYEHWLAGRNHRLQPGNVVRNKSDEKTIGVIQYPLCDMETYAIKWYIGPKPWDFIEGQVMSSCVTVTNEPNPLKYKWSERVPGPSSDEIDRLEAAFAKKAKKEFTAREADLNAALLEEELSKKRAIKKIDESKVDSIVDETLEEDIISPIEDISVDQKIKNILNEE